MGSITRQQPKRIAFESISKWNNCTCWWFGCSTFPVGNTVAVYAKFAGNISFGESEVLTG